MVATRNITDLNVLVTPDVDDIMLIVEKLSATSTEAKQITWGNLVEGFQDVVGALATDSTSVDFTYDDANGQLTASVTNNTSTQKSIYNDGTNTSTRQEARFSTNTGLDIAVSDDSGNDRANISVKNTGIVSAGIDTGLTGTYYSFLSGTPTAADGSKSLELKVLKAASNKLTITSADSGAALALDIDPSQIDINTLNTTSPLGVSVGGTGGTTALSARNGIGAAKKGSNGDITALTGLTTALSISQGGTGNTTAAAGLKALSGLASVVSVGTTGTSLVEDSSSLNSGSYRAELRGLLGGTGVSLSVNQKDITIDVSASTLLGSLPAAASQTVDINGALLTNAASPQSDTDVATRGYVNSVAQGLDVKEAVRVATTAQLGGTYSTPPQTFTSNVNGAITVDGVALDVADRLLLKDQNTKKRNGIYVVTTKGDGSNPFVLTRAADFNASSEVGAGAFMFVEEGSTNAGKSFIQAETGPTLDTDILTFQLFGTSSLSAGSVDNAKLANMSQARIKGRAAGAGSGAPTDLTAGQLIGVINAAGSGTIDTARLNTTGLAPTASPTFTGTVTIPSGASINGFAELGSAQSFTKAQRGTPSTLTDNPGGSVSADLDDGNNFNLTLTGSANNTRTLANPSNKTPGQSGVITITQSSSGSNLLTYGSDWDFAGSAIPLSTAANAVDTLAYYVISSSKIRVVLIKD